MKSMLFGLGIWAAGWLFVYFYIVTAKFLGTFVNKIPIISIKYFIYISFAFFTWFLISTLYYGYPFGVLINLIMLYFYVWMGIGYLIFNSLANLKITNKILRKILDLVSKIPVIGNPIILLILIILAYGFLGVELMLGLITYLKIVLN